MALFPAFAGVSEAPDSGSARKGKRAEGTKKTLGGLKTYFLRPLALDLLVHLCPSVPRGAAKPPGKGPCPGPGSFGARVLELRKEKDLGGTLELGLP